MFDKISFGTQSSDDHIIQSVIAKAVAPQATIRNRHPSPTDGKQTQHPTHRETQERQTMSHQRHHEEVDAPNLQHCHQGSHNPTRHESDDSDQSKANHPTDLSRTINDPLTDEPDRSPNEWSSGDAYPNAVTREASNDAHPTPVPQNEEGAATAKEPHNPTTLFPQENTRFPMHSTDAHAGWLVEGHEDSASADEGQQSEDEEGDEGAMEVEEAEMELSSTPDSVKT